MIAEWTKRRPAFEEGTFMLLGERVRELRKERGLTQAELGSKIGTDAGRISRYEGGRITPSLEALVRLADVLEVSVDYLVREGVPRRSLDGVDLGPLGEHLGDLAELSEDDRAALLRVLDGLVARSRLKALAGGIS
ncbi:MAG TPA: helix-turn-helix transcriptional regulator [Solirubrobacteraceae bacterium]|nr:helix-turn-helix transcriptional regulator [Solirubrobacteraceae bacterium]